MDHSVADWSLDALVFTSLVRMTAFEPLTLRYALHELPPERLPFSRWRWELWNGSRLEATGWQLTERDASRSVRRHASRAGHRVLGVPPRTTRSRDFEPFRPGASVRVRDGAVVVALVPLQLDVPDRAEPTAHR